MVSAHKLRDPSKSAIHQTVYDSETLKVIILHYNVFINDIFVDYSLVCSNKPHWKILVF